MRNGHLKFVASVKIGLKDTKIGLVYLIHTYIYKLRKSSLKEKPKITKIVDGFINNVYLQSRQNIYIYNYLLMSEGQVKVISIYIKVKVISRKNEKNNFFNLFSIPHIYF